MVIMAVLIRNTSGAVIRPQYTPWPTDLGPVGLGQYDSLGEYCGLHTASSVFFILRIDNGSQSGAQYWRIKTLGVIIIHVTYSESSYFSLLDDSSLITVNQELWKISISH